LLKTGVSKNLARYRSENNFVVRTFKALMIMLQKILTF